MRENDKSKNDWCGFYFHSLNRIFSGTTKIEQWIRESNTSRNDRLRFHCIYPTVWKTAMLVWLMGGIYEVHHWDGLSWDDDVWHFRTIRHSSNIQVITSMVREAAMLVITDGKDLWSMLLWWPQVTWRTCNTSWWSALAFKQCYRYYLNI
jgi:hypothetical protein